MTPHKKTVFALVLGASSFPLCEPIQHSGGDAFQASAKKFVDCLSNLFGTDWISNEAQFLSLFDDPDGAAEQIRKISLFLQRANNDGHHLLIYYVGHGGFVDHEEYYLALKSTRLNYERISALPIKVLADTIKLEFAKGNVYLVLDCCFAGAAVRSFQSGSLERSILNANRKAFPRTGTAVFCASSKDNVALSQGSGDLTQFSECLTEVLEKGIPGAESHLSLRTISAAVRKRGERFGYQQIDPDLHSPRQEGTDASDHAFIPNAAHPNAYTVDQPRSAIPENLGLKNLRTTNQDPSQPYETKGRWWWSLGVAVAVIIGIGIFFALFVRVPNVVGTAKDEAVQELTNSGFDVKAKEVLSERADFDEVVELNPAPGSWALRGSEVDILVSGYFVQIPNLLSELVEDGSRTLNELGLKTTLHEIREETTPFRAIVKMHPAPGGWARKGSYVDLTFSGFFVQVPDLLGDDGNQAVQFLRELNLVATVREVGGAQGRHGEVIELVPPPGTRIRSGSLIEVAIRKRTPVVVPRVKNLSVDVAATMLESAGFRVETRYEESNEATVGKVIEQDPEGGESSVPGGVVSISVANGWKRRTVKELNSEFRRLGYTPRMASVLDRRNEKAVLEIQSRLGLIATQLEPVELVRLLKTLVLVPTFSTEKYEDVQRALTALGLSPKKNVVSRDQFSYFCAILVKTFIVKSISPPGGSVLKKGSVVIIDVHEEWSIEPDPLAARPGCEQRGYEPL